MNQEKGTAEKEALRNASVWKTLLRILASMESMESSRPDRSSTSGIWAMAKITNGKLASSTKKDFVDFGGVAAPGARR